MKHHQPEVEYYKFQNSSPKNLLYFSDFVLYLHYLLLYELLYYHQTGNPINIILPPFNLSINL